MSKFFLSSIVSKCQKSLVKYLSDIVDHINLQEFFENLFHLMKPLLKQQEFTQHGEKGAEKNFLGLQKNHSSVRPMAPSSRVLGL